MKKILIADVIKASYDEFRDQRNEEILAEMDRSDVNEPTAEYLVDNWSSEADRDQVLQVAESLGLDPQDVEDDDVENYMEMGGNKGEMESSVGPIQWIYDNKAKAYIVYMVVTIKNDQPRDIIYNIEPDVMKEWIDSGSMGEYWNNNIRSNKDIENKASSSDFPIGGCNDNLLDPSTVSRFNTRFVAIS